MAQERTYTQAEVVAAVEWDHAKRMWEQSWFDAERAHLEGIRPQATDEEIAAFRAEQEAFWGEHHAARGGFGPESDPLPPPEQLYPEMAGWIDGSTL